MSADILALLQKLVKDGMVSFDLVPEILKIYSELRKQLGSGESDVMLKQFSGFLPEGMWKQMGLPSYEDGLLLFLAMNFATAKHLWQSKGPEQQPENIFFPAAFLGKKCAHCNFQNLFNADYCSKCGKKL